MSDCLVDLVMGNQPFQECGCLTTFYTDNNENGDSNEKTCPGGQFNWLLWILSCCFRLPFGILICIVCLVLMFFTEKDARHYCSNCHRAIARCGFG